MPPVETEADRASFFDADEFAQVADIRGENIDGYLDEQTELIDDLAPVAVQTTNPVFMCSSDRVPDDLADREPIRITRDDGSTFEGVVIREDPDGFGMSTLILESNG